MRVAIVLVVLAGACSERAASAPTICGSIHEGTECQSPGERCVTYDCRALALCVCDGVSYGCGALAPATDGGACDAMQCQVEGHAACNIDPVSGGCDCADGAWRCFSSCPAGCPRERPAEGSACTLPAGVSCPYEDPPFGGAHVMCACANGSFSCR